MSKGQGGRAAPSEHDSPAPGAAQSGKAPGKTPSGETQPVGTPPETTPLGATKAGSRAGAPAGSPLRTAAWSLLAGLLMLLTLAAWLEDRAGWDRPLPGEATVLMQAESLLRDADLSYQRTDFDRFVDRWRTEPADLELLSASGRRIAYDRPFPYALFLAPFMALDGRAGFALANALLLALAAWLAARALSARLGPLAPLWTVTVIFASSAFVYVFLAREELFLFVLAMLAAVGLESARQRHRPGRARLAGLLLAILVVSQPLLLVLLPVMLFWPEPALPEGANPKLKNGAGGRTPFSVRGPLLVGFTVGLLVLAAAQWWSGGGLLWIGVSEFRFTPASGFPLVDFGSGTWTQTVSRLNALYWQGAPDAGWGLEWRLWLWNGLYALVGRSVGLLPYFPALLVLPWMLSRSRRRLALLLILVWLLALLLMRPFHLDALPILPGNSLFLPVFGLVCLLVDRRRPVWLWLLPVLLAAPFLAELWRAPREAVSNVQQGSQPLSKAAYKVLPYETSQRNLPAGDEAALGTGLWVRMLSEAGWLEETQNRLVMDSASSLSLLVASPQPLSVLRLDFGPQAPGQIEILRGAEIEDRVLLADGGIAFRLLPSGQVRRHAMWWTPQPRYLYQLAFRMPNAEVPRLPFTVSGE